MSQITTHILDTALGQPAAGVTILLYGPHESGWQQLARGQTNADGRLSDLLDPASRLAPGTYKMKFLTGAYFEQKAIPTFYPFVEIVFTVSGPEHYHIPLLVSPFGYTTYRGS